jgi:adenylylsulfate kinase
MEHITPHTFNITKEDRIRLKKHDSFLIWFTGLSGSGKSTIANAVEKALFEKGIHTYALDGDNIRGGLNKGLGFDEEDRKENIRRIAEVAKLFIDAGLVVTASFVSPYKNDRFAIAQTVGSANFIEVFVNTPIAVCEDRDVKGLYAMARAGKIKNMTGIDAPYEAPLNPSIEIDTSKMSIEESVALILEHIDTKLNIYNE